MHLDAALDERRADRVLRRERIDARSDDLRARLSERKHKTGGLRLEVDDDRELAAAQRAVREALGREPVRAQACAAGPVDAAVPFGRECEVGDARAAGGSGGGGHRSGEGRT